jgi:hypothetical protein
MAAHRYFNLSNWTPAYAGEVAEGISVTDATAGSG